MHFLIPKTKLKTRDSNVFNDFSIFGTDSKHKKKDVRTETEDPEAVQVPYKIIGGISEFWDFPHNPKTNAPPDANCTGIGYLEWNTVSVF